MTKKMQINVTEDQLKLIQYFMKEMPQEDDALFEEFEDYIDARCILMEMDRKEQLASKDNYYLMEMDRKEQIARDLDKLNSCLVEFGKKS